MTFKISFASHAVPSGGTVVITVASGGKLGAMGAKIDALCGGTIKRAMAAEGFKGESEKTLRIVAPAGGGYSRIILVGTGEASSADRLAMMKAGGAAMASLKSVKDDKASVVIDDYATNPESAANFALGARLRSYRFDKYRTAMKPDEKTTLKFLSILCAKPDAAGKAYAVADKVADGVFLTRDLVSEPANALYPEALAAKCAELRKLGIEVEILDEKRLEKLGMGALLGVAQGSVRPARVVVMVWRGDKSAKDKRPLAFIGKGVTFDTGGISLKPANGMEKMKYDMAGAGAVIGAMAALAGRKAKANVVGVVGLVENMPSGYAQRPGDVVSSMSGKTIEVINTDAEGRLVLADLVWYAQEKLRPSAMVDLATLTGAVTVALGGEYAGLFSGDEKLAADLLKAAEATGESLWRLPLNDAYDKELDSAIADMKNVSSGGGAGSAMGAHFIKRFVKEKTSWAHLDIAGMAWADKDRPLCPKGATAFGVRLLDNFARGREKK